MVNNKGWIRIIEASIAIMLVLTGVLVIVSHRESKKSTDLTVMGRGLLDEVAKDNELRAKIVDLRIYSGNQESNGDLTIFLSERINTRIYGFSAIICNYNEACYFNPYPAPSEKEAFASERIISASLASNSPDPTSKKVVLLLWKN